MSLFDSMDPVELTTAVLERLERLVTLESPSTDEAGLKAVAAEVTAQLVAAGAAVETVAVPGVGEHLVARIPGSGGAPAASSGVASEAGEDAAADGAPDERPLLVMVHVDTVHPVGTFEPVFRVEDGRARGPGVYDMKGGIACVLEALRRLHASDARPRRPVTVLVTCDEETGSHTSRRLIEELAARSRAVLVPEPALPGGGVKTRRKGVGVYRLEVRGQATHAGLALEDGVNAVVELSHQILAATALSDPGVGTSVTVCETGGGTASNVVPEHAWATFDVRFTRASEAERVDAAIRALTPRLEGAALTITGGVNRPPLERTDEIAALYEHARRLAAETGEELEEGMSGGASDGSFTAALGVPTLDGLGPDGGGAHAAHEHVLVDDLPRRVRLFGRLFETL